MRLLAGRGLELHDQLRGYSPACLSRRYLAPWPALGPQWCLVRSSLPGVRLGRPGGNASRTYPLTETTPEVALISDTWRKLENIGHSSPGSVTGRASSGDAPA